MIKLISSFQPHFKSIQMTSNKFLKGSLLKVESFIVF